MPTPAWCARPLWPTPFPPLVGGLGLAHAADACRLPARRRRLPVREVSSSVPPFGLFYSRLAPSQSPGYRSLWHGPLGCTRWPKSAGGGFPGAVFSRWWRASGADLGGTTRGGWRWASSPGVTLDRSMKASTSARRTRYGRPGAEAVPFGPGGPLGGPSPRPTVSGGRGRRPPLGRRASRPPRRI